MQNPDQIRRDLPPDLERSVEEQLVSLGMRLQDHRPTPGPGFRGNLRRGLLEAEGRHSRLIAPRLVRVLSIAYTVSGLLLLVIPGVGLAGIGPFALG